MGEEKMSFIDCFFEFLKDSENLDQEELRTELEELGIDTEKLVMRASKIVEEESRKRRLIWQMHAKEKRSQIESAVEMMESEDAPVDLKNKIGKIFSNKFSLPSQTYAEAYFRKIDSLSEKDLKSLLEDIEHLELLEEISEED